MAAARRNQLIDTPDGLAVGTAVPAVQESITVEPTHFRKADDVAFTPSMSTADLLEAFRFSLLAESTVQEKRHDLMCAALEHIKAHGDTVLASRMMIAARKHASRPTMIKWFMEHAKLVWVRNHNGDWTFMRNPKLKKEFKLNNIDMGKARANPYYAIKLADDSTKETKAKTLPVFHLEDALGKAVKAMNEYVEFTEVGASRAKKVFDADESDPITKADIEAFKASVKKLFNVDL